MRHHPKGGRYTALEKNVLKHRAFEMVLVLFEVQHLKDFVLGSIRATDSQRYAPGRCEPVLAVEHHRVRDVQEQHRRARRPVLGLVHHEVAIFGHRGVVRVYDNRKLRYMGQLVSEPVESRDNLLYDAQQSSVLVPHQMSLGSNRRFSKAEVVPEKSPPKDRGFPSSFFGDPDNCSMAMSCTAMRKACLRLACNGMSAATARTR